MQQTFSQCVRNLKSDCCQLDCAIVDISTAFDIATAQISVLVNQLVPSSADDKILVNDLLSEESTGWPKIIAYAGVLERMDACDDVWNRQFHDSVDPETDQNLADIALYCEFISRALTKLPDSRAIGILNLCTTNIASIASLKVLSNVLSDPRNVSVLKRSHGTLLINICGILSDATLAVDLKDALSRCTLTHLLSIVPSEATYSHCNQVCLLLCHDALEISMISKLMLASSVSCMIVCSACAMASPGPQAGWLHALVTSHHFWQCMQLCVQSNDGLLQKRGVFVLEKLCCSTPWIPTLDPPSSSSCSSISLSSTNDRWAAMFVSVHHQVEDSSSGHLVQQMWGVMTALCELALPNTSSDHGLHEGDSPCACRLEFGWIKALLMSLLRCQVMTVRKGALLSLLTGEWVLPPSAEVVQWVCEELLPAIDHAAYFPGEFPYRWESDCDCTRALECVKGHQSEARMAVAYRTACAAARQSCSAAPGGCVPQFMAWLLAARVQLESSCSSSALAAASHEQQSPSMLKQLIKVIANKDQRGMACCLTIKWLLRCFAEESVVQMMLSHGLRLDDEDLFNIKYFLDVQLSCANNAVKNQIYHGVLGMLQSSLIGSADGASACSVMVVIVTCIGLQQVAKDKVYLNLFLNSSTLRGLQSVLTVNEDCDGILHAAHSIDVGLKISCAATAFLLHSIFSMSNSILTSGDDTVVQALCVQCSKLYSSPYMSLRCQSRCCWFIHGIAAGISFVCDNKQQLESCGLASDWMVRLSVLSRQLAVHDLVCYLIRLVKASLTRCIDEETSSDVQSFQNDDSIRLLVTSMTVLRGMSEAVGGLLVLEEITHCSGSSTSNTYNRAVDKPVAIAVTALLVWFTGIIESLFKPESGPLDSQTPSLCLVPVMACCAVIVSQVHRVLKTCQHDDEASRALTRAVAGLGNSLIRAQEPLPQCYKTSSLRLLKTEHKSGLGSCSPQLLMLLEIQESFVHVSSLAASVSANRWQITRQCCDVCASSGNCVDHLGLLSLACVQLSACSEACLCELISASAIALHSALAVVASSTLSLRNNTSTAAASAVVVQEVGVAEELFAVCWGACAGCSDFNYKAFVQFINLVFHESVLALIDPQLIKIQFDHVWSLGRAHLTQLMVCRLCCIWKTQPHLCVPFSPDIAVRILLHKEVLVEEHELPGDTAPITASTASRVMLLVCLEHFCGRLRDIDRDNRLEEMLENLVRCLLTLNKSKEFTVAAIPGSELFGRKLRSWQALCVLCSSVNKRLLSEIIDDYFGLLSFNCVQPIRLHLELFGAMMLTMHPVLMMPRLLAALALTNHSQQMLSTYFVILGHALLGRRDDSILLSSSLSSSQSVKNAPSESSDSASWLSVVDARELVRVLVPWMTCAAGLPRSIAQSVTAQLVPLIKSPSHDIEDSMFTSILRHLTENKDTTKVLAKQKKFFEEHSLRDRCSVLGLVQAGQLSHICGSGEIISEHVLAMTLDVLRSCEQQQREESEQSCHQQLHQQCTPTTQSSNFSVQTKRVPQCDLLLSLGDEFTHRSTHKPPGASASISDRSICSTSSSNKTAQSVVLCASLICKEVNLAGIARTCEIFGVTELVVPSMQLVHTDAFKGVAVSATNWIAMSEVSPAELSTYLLSMKRKGYVIIGVEQTGSSQQLQDVTFPHKMVVLLGKEKEGIPMELLQVIDICVEIPQFGIIRSLNVHVSAALVIWEITKQSIAHKRHK